MADKRKTDAPKVLIASTEMYPFFKLGGLGDVIGQLPGPLNSLGIDARVIMPLTSKVPENFVKKMKHVFTREIDIPWRKVQYDLRSLTHGGVRVYFIDCPRYFQNGELFGHWEDGEHMLFFSKAIVDCAMHLDFTPDIIHCNDWHTALVPLYLKEIPSYEPLSSTMSVLTVHNLRYTGWAGTEVLQEFPQFAQFLESEPEIRSKCIKNIHLDYLAAGILYADIVTTVSPTHAGEIMTPSFGGDLYDLLRMRGHAVRGILNGIDTQVFDPATDPALINHYAVATLDKREANTQSFRKEVGLVDDPRAMLVIFVGRMVPQKGIDAIVEAVPSIMGLHIQLAVIGQDSDGQADRLKTFVDQYPGRMYVLGEYDVDLTQRAFSQADAIIMPSTYEPCGLVQLIAMRYGALPICHRTGGLVDTVSDYGGGLNPYADGFLYGGEGGQALQDAVSVAANVWEKRPAHWRKMQINAMGRDSGFESAAKAYADLYIEMLGTSHYIFHDSWDPVFRSPSGAVTPGTEVRLSVRAGKFDSAGLRLHEKGNTTVIPMKRSGDMFTAVVKMPDEPCNVLYDFILTEGEEFRYYGNNPEQIGGVGMMVNLSPPPYRITVYRPCPVPAWFKEGVIYQIFPDSFCRGDDWEARRATLLEGRWEPQHRQIPVDWEDPPRLIFNDIGYVRDWEYHGGTLEGVTSKIGYLKSLGITMVYMTPVFLSPSNHHYDTTDYSAIDPSLGDDRSFDEMCQTMEKEGIRLLLDGVFNHVGEDSPYFDIHGRFGGGAFGNPDSEYAEWFEFTDGTCRHYSSWAIEPGLPKISRRSAGYREFICGEDGIIDKWMKRGVAGWRLDAAEYLGEDFTAAAHRVVSSRGGVVFGEVVFDPTWFFKDIYKNMLCQGTMDSTTGYPVRSAVIQFVNGEVGSHTVVSRILSLKEGYPPEQFYSQVIFLGCHDTVRVRSYFDKGDAKSTDAMVSVQAVMIFSLPGVPSLYYGDETGIEGKDDPDNRRTFPWGKEDPVRIGFFRDLIAFYRAHPCLVYGDLRFETPSDDVIIIKRKWEDQTQIAVIDRVGGYRCPSLSGTEEVFPPGGPAAEGMSAAIYIVRDGKAGGPQ